LKNSLKISKKKFCHEIFNRILHLSYIWNQYLFITLCCFSFINQIIFNIFNFFIQMNIFVSNINYATKDYELQDLFSEFGEVSSVKIITDKETGRSRGFGFVEMEDAEGQQAIEALNQKEFNGKTLNVSEAKPREEKPRRSFGGGGNAGGGNRGGSGGYGGGGNRGGSSNRGGSGGYGGGGDRGGNGGGKRW
jgi:hypothetical protein